MELTTCDGCGEGMLVLATIDSDGGAEDDTQYYCYECLEPDEIVTELD